jgi:sugar phosphate permease
VRPYRWAILAAGTVAQASFAASGIGLPVLVPSLQEEFQLSLREIGALLAAEWIGTLATLLLWGLAADRWGERVVLGVGLGGCAACLAGAAYAPSFEVLFLLLVLAGASGASVISASGRAVMHWFTRDERGLALGIRQTAIPLGGLVAALVLPVLTDAGGSQDAFLFLAGFCAVGALAGAAVLRGQDAAEATELESVARTLRDGRLWRLCLGSGVYVYAQVAIIGFGVLFLHDEHGFSERSAAFVFAVALVLGGGLRIGMGRWSDVVRSRLKPLRVAGIAVSVGVAATALLASGPVLLLVPALALAGGLSMAWNGLAFTAAAELAGAGRSGAAIGVQQSVLSGLAVVAPLVFSATVSASTWAAAFALAAVVPLAGWLALGALRDY